MGCKCELLMPNTLMHIALAIILSPQMTSALSIKNGDNLLHMDQHFNFVEDHIE